MIAQISWTSTKGMEHHYSNGYLSFDDGADIVPESPTGIQSGYGVLTVTTILCYSHYFHTQAFK